MGSIIFPSDDLKAYRITPVANISEEEEDSLFKKHKRKHKKNSEEQSEEDKKTNDLIIQRRLLKNFFIYLEDSDINIEEIISYALIKKDILKPALDILVKNKCKQDKSNVLFNLFLAYSKFNSIDTNSWKKRSIKTEKRDLTSKVFGKSIK